MQIEQTRWNQAGDWTPAPPGKLEGNAQVVLLFVSPACFRQTPWQDEIRNAYPNAHRIGGSTSGTEVIAISFQHTQLEVQ
jgi:hypothetical protein